MQYVCNQTTTEKISFGDESWIERVWIAISYPQLCWRNAVLFFVISNEFLINASFTRIYRFNFIFAFYLRFVSIFFCFFFLFKAIRSHDDDYRYCICTTINILFDIYLYLSLNISQKTNSNIWELIFGWLVCSLFFFFYANDAANKVSAV